MELFFACLIILFAIIILYIVLVKLFISMLVATGLSRRVARFQIFSVFSSTGFTTKESELIMIDNTRRKVILAAMFTNYIFSILVTSLLIGIVLNLDFSGDNDGVYFRRLLVILGIAAALLILTIILTNTPSLKKVFFKMIKSMIYKNAANGENEIFFHEIIGANKYLASVKIFFVPTAFKDKTIEECDFSQYGIIILAVSKNDIVYTEKFESFKLSRGMEIEVYGGAAQISKLFY